VFFSKHGVLHLHTTGIFLRYWDIWFWLL